MARKSGGVIPYIPGNTAGNKRPSTTSRKTHPPERVQAANTQNFNTPAQNNGGGGGGAAPVSTLASLPQTPAIQDLIAKGIIKEGMSPEQIQAILSISGLVGQVPLDIEALKKQLMADYAATTGGILGSGQDWMQQLYGANFSPTGPNAAAFQNDPLFSSYAGGLAQMEGTSGQMQATDLAWFDKQQQLQTDYYNGLMASISSGGLAAGGGSGGGGGGGGGGRRRYGGGGGGGGSGDEEGDFTVNTVIKDQDTVASKDYTNIEWLNPETFQYIVGAHPELGQDYVDLATRILIASKGDPSSAAKLAQDTKAEVVAALDANEGVVNSNQAWTDLAGPRAQAIIQQYLGATGSVMGDNPETTDVVEPWYLSTEDEDETNDIAPSAASTMSPETMALMFPGPKGYIYNFMSAAMDPNNPIANPAGTGGYGSASDVLTRLARLRLQGLPDQPTGSGGPDAPGGMPGIPLTPEQIASGKTDSGLTVDPLTLEQQVLDAVATDEVQTDDPTGANSLDASGNPIAGIRRQPALYDPNAPGPVQPYQPGPGETYDDQTWFDADGNIIGYAETEESPLRGGPKWWDQDANNGLPDNYYDLQNYFSAGGGALKANASNYLREGVKDAIAARESRAYNAGQRGMPVENGLFSQALLAQLEANMDRNISSSNLQYNMDLYGGKNGPTNPFDPANGPPIDVGGMIKARAGQEPEPLPDWTNQGGNDNDGSAAFIPPPGWYYHNGAWFDDSDQLKGYAPTPNFAPGESQAPNNATISNTPEDRGYISYPLNISGGGISGGPVAAPTNQAVGSPEADAGTQELVDRILAQHKAYRTSTAPGYLPPTSIYGSPAPNNATISSPNAPPSATTLPGGQTIPGLDTTTTTTPPTTTISPSVAAPPQEYGFPGSNILNTVASQAPLPTHLIPATDDPMTTINATVPDAVTDVLNSSNPFYIKALAKAALPGNAGGGITTGVPTPPTPPTPSSSSQYGNIGMMEAMAAIGMAPSLGTYNIKQFLPDEAVDYENGNLSQASWEALASDRAGAEPLESPITPGTLVKYYQDTALNPETGQLSPEAMLALQNESMSELSSLPNPAGLTLDELAVQQGEGKYWRQPIYTQEQIDQYNADLLSSDPLMAAILERTDYVSPQNVLQKTLETAGQSSTNTTTATAKDTGNEYLSLTDSLDPNATAVDDLTLFDPAEEIAGFGGGNRESINALLGFEARHRPALNQVKAGGGSSRTSQKTNAGKPQASTVKQLANKAIKKFGNKPKHYRKS